MNGNVLLFREITIEALDLCDVYATLGPLKQETRMSDDVAMGCQDWEYLARMVLKTLSGRTRKNFEGTPEHYP
jgi:hypothetical protein